MEQPTGILIVAADHPALAGDIEAFLDRVQREHRFFGPTARSNPKPFPSLMASLRERGGFRMAAVECGRIVGLARVDGSGELFLAIGEEHRGRGIGTALGRAMAGRASDLHFGRLVLRTTRRSQAARRIGEQLGAVVIHRGRGRTELVLDLLPGERTA
jgi:RimJ/RimL family protein N-acetyltransferase